MVLKQLAILFFIFYFNIGYAQTWNQLESEYNTLLNNKKNDSALIKAKEIYSWVKVNEGDTSLHLPISLKLIGNAFINNDSAIKYFETALLILKNQFREEHVQYSNILFNIGNRYRNIGNYNLAEEKQLKSLTIYSKISNDDKNYFVRLFWLGILYTEMNEYSKAIIYFSEVEKKYKKNIQEVDISYKDLLKNIVKAHYELKNDKLLVEYQKKLSMYLQEQHGRQSMEYTSSLMDLGKYYLEFEDFKSAEYHLLTSLKIKENLSNETYEFADNLNSLGILYSKIGDYEAAKKNAIKSALIIKNILGMNSSEYLASIGNLAVIHFKLGEYSQAINYLNINLAVIFKNEGDACEEYASALNNIGNAYFFQFENKKAEFYYLKALNIRKIYSESNFEALCSSLNNLGAFYLRLNNFSKAEEYLLQCVGQYEKNDKKLCLDYATALDNLANLYSEKFSYNDAELYYIKALNILGNTLSSKSSEYFRVLNNLGSLYIRIGNFDKAKKLIEESLINYTCSTQSLDCIAKTSNLGMIYHNQRNYKKAEKYYLKSLGICKKYYGVENDFYTSDLENFALLMIDESKIESAKSNYKTLTKIKNSMLSKDFFWLNENEKETYCVNEQNIYSSLYYFSSKYSKSKSLSVLSYNSNLVEKSLLLETTININKVVKNTQNVALINIYNESKIKKKHLSKLISDMATKNIFLKNIQNQIDSLDKILLNSISELRSLKEQLNIDWKNVQTNLNNNEASIEFSRYYDDSDSAFHYMALVVKHGDKYPQLVKLCKVDELKQYSPETELKEIYDLVWKPLLPYLEGIKTVYYSPSGILNNIPFQALYKIENGQKEYVMDKFTLHQLTSTRYLALDLKKKEQETIETSIALFGGINYNDFPNAVIDTINSDESSEAAFLYKNAIVLNRELDSTRTGASYLPGTKKEVETIADVLNAKQWQVDISQGKNASENKIKSLSGKSSKAILHIATHGFAYPDKVEKRKDMAFSMMRGNDKYKASDNPMIRSGLLFGGANMTWQGKGDSLLNSTNEDGVLTAYELSQLDLSNTKLAVLSACETGKGAIQGSEGTFGLKRALKLAGVDNMIVSLWKVPDDATMEMMTLFYTELANTKKPVSSFETAQKAMRFKYPNEPKMWAGFVFVR